MPGKNPDLFHGYFRPDGFFEGWYFRIRWEGRSICFIPGVAVGDDPHAFVQVIDSEGLGAYNLRYPLADFSCGARTPAVRVGQNLFSLSHIRPDLKDVGLSLTGALALSEVRTYPDWWLGRGSMGCVGGLAFLECYTQICALDGRVDGTLVLNGRALDIRGGRLYVEKNWGHSFPKAYCWVQGDFGEDVGLACSIGRVPVGGTSFDGMVACLRHGDRLYHFHTLRGGGYDLDNSRKGTWLTARCGRYALKLRVKGGHPLRLAAPIRGSMGGAAYECLDATASLMRFDLDTGACLLQRSGREIGLEIGGRWLPEETSPPVSPL